MTTMTTVIVTRHPALVQYLHEIGLTTGAETVLSHVSEADVTGRVVIGVLPLHLAAVAERVIEVPLSVPPELRGVELTLEQVRQHAGTPVAYSVRRVVAEIARRDLE
jgi:putative CRISPR-associated protein (TIGR02620 family)